MRTPGDHDQTCDERPGGRYAALVAEHADRGYREQPLDPGAPPAELAFWLAGFAPVRDQRERDARQERGAA